MDHCGAIFPLYILKNIRIGLKKKGHLFDPLLAGFLSGRSIGGILAMFVLTSLGGVVGSATGSNRGSIIKKSIL